MQYLTMAQDNFMTAFSARALADAADFTASIEGVIKEVGSKDPSAMNMKVSLQASKSEQKWPTAHFTFIQRNKGNLLAKLKAIKKAVVDVQCEHSRDEDCKKMGDIVKITKARTSAHFGKGKFVFVDIKMPKGPQESDADKKMMTAIKEHDPKLVAEVN